MADKTTFIKLDRNIERWRWYKNANTMRVFLHLLLNANVSDHDFETITIHRGEIATSYKSIADALEMSVQEVRTAIKHLKSTGELTGRTYKKFQVLSILRYSTYQSASTGTSTGKQQGANIQSTGKQQQYKNVKNNKNEKNIGGGAPEWAPPAKGTPEYDAWRNQ